jgi:hypothetical protein
MDCLLPSQWKGMSSVMQAIPENPGLLGRMMSGFICLLPPEAVSPSISLNGGFVVETARSA